MALEFLMWVRPPAPCPELQLYTRHSLLELAVAEPSSAAKIRTPTPSLLAIFFFFCCCCTERE